MTVAEESRAAQAEAIKDFRHADEMLVEVIGVYDGVDALTSAQRRLLTASLLVSASDLLTQGAGNPVLLSLARSALAVIGYVNELEREALGETTTGDASLAPILQHLNKASSLLYLEHLSEEDEARARAMRAEIDARVAAGEGEDAVVGNIAKRFEARANHPSNGQPQADVQGEHGYGMYL